MLLLLAGLIAMGGNAESQGAGPRLLAWITVASSGSMVEFTGMAESDGPTSVRYSMRILRTGGGGRSVTSQGGRAQLARADQPHQLSTVSLNIEDGSSYAVELLVTSESGTKTSVTIGNPALQPL